MSVYTARAGFSAVSLLVVLFTGLCAATAMAQEPLLSYQPIRASMMPLDTDPATVAEYEVAFNAWALARSERHAAEFILPDGSRFMAVPEEIKFRGDWATDFAWRGRLEGNGEHGRAVITVHRGYISGRITLSGRDVITLKPGPEPGMARLLEHDSSKFPGCAADTHEEFTAPAGSPAPASFPPVAPASAGSAPIIDVMVLYTPMAANRADIIHNDPDAIETIIHNAVDLTNDAYANSGVHQRINLVYLDEVDYEGDLNGDSGNAQRDWLLVEVNLGDLKDLRDQHQADMVALISGSIPGLCGLAFTMDSPSPSFQAAAVSVVQWSCAVTSLAFPHELGHNMGLEHDPDPDFIYSPPPGSASYVWSFGHFFELPNGDWKRTVMSYPNRCGGSCPPIEYFSNPNVLYSEPATDPGVPTGIANERDNARALNLTANIVANFRQGNWLYADRFEERGYALSGTTAPPPMTQAEACDELETQLSQFEAHLAEKGTALDETDEDATREFEEETAAVEEIRNHLANECQ